MKIDFYTANNIAHVDYKDVEILKRFINPNGKIQSRRRTGLSATHQRQVALAIKRARFMGLMPYISR
ncbi:30S ribosomal protein S18 [Candidatus Nomurabacteria bacterium]|nr:30S ribosomal protein S18 [Candidatus Nomurabacteria bacterium]MCB9820885.1 30S ribosomal protein S18 [Candidatus Nomurabacteria bacterium]